MTQQSNIGMSIDTSKVYNPEMFPEQIIALNREIINHPALMKILADQPNKDVYIRLLEIATYCNVLIIAEVWTHEDILWLCEQLTKALYEKRTQLIIPFKEVQTPAIQTLTVPSKK